MGEQPRYLRMAWLGLAAVIAVTSPLEAQTAAPARKSQRPADQPARSADFPEETPAPSDVAPSPTPRPGGLRMSRAVVCRTINGYEDYEPLPDAAQTSEEKLLIYFRPLRYKIESADGYYRAHLVQDNEIRKQGAKEIVRQKRKVVEYEPKSKNPLGPLYIRNTISLKDLKPGDYDLTIILHDELEKDAPPTRQVVRFKVIPPHDGRTKRPTRKAGSPPPAR
jgi:hypothetical protein